MPIAPADPARVTELVLAGLPAGHAETLARKHLTVTDIEAWGLAPRHLAAADETWVEHLVASHAWVCEADAALARYDGSDPDKLQDLEEDRWYAESALDDAIRTIERGDADQPFDDYSRDPD